MKARFGSLNSNYTKISNLLGNKFLVKSQLDILTIDDFFCANYFIGSYCYGDEINESLWKRNIKAVDELYLEYLKSLELDRFDNFDFSKIGVVLIRPECAFYKDIYRDFLEKRDLEIIFEKEICVDFRQYMLLYYDSLILEDTLYDFPSRTFNYINNISYLFVVSHKSKKNLANYLTSIKGKQGKYEIGTLRGDISYNLLKENVHNGQLMRDAIIPLDPIGAGRMLTRNMIPHDGSHNVSNIPILFYAGQSVHVPNENEIKRDCVALCNSNEMEYILKKVRRN